MRFSFRYKIITLCIAASALPLILVCYFAGISLLYSLLALLACALISGFFAVQLSSPLIDGMNSLETGLLNFKDGELATLLAYDGSDELGDLCRLYNQTAKPGCLT